MQAAAAFVSSPGFPNGLALNNGGIVIPNSPSLDNCQIITLEIWMKADHLSCGYPILKKGSYGFPKFVGGRRLQVFNPGMLPASQYMVYESDHQLHYYVMTSSQEATNVYIDGQMVFTGMYSVIVLEV